MQYVFAYNVLRHYLETKMAQAPPPPPNKFVKCSRAARKSSCLLKWMSVFKTQRSSLNSISCGQKARSPAQPAGCVFRSDGVVHAVRPLSPFTLPSRPLFGGSERRGGGGGSEVCKNANEYHTNMQIYRMTSLN